MASIKFRIKNTKDPQTIFARLYCSGIDKEIKTGFKIPKKDWSEAKGRVKLTKNSSKKFDEINTSLIGLEEFFYNEINKAHSKGNTITKEWLGDITNRYFNQPRKGSKDDSSLFYIPFVEDYIEKSKTKIRPQSGKPLSPRTIDDYKGTLKKLKHFEKEIWKNKIRHIDITLNFHEKFIAYCVEYHKIKPKTIGGEIDNIKKFIRVADLQDIKVCKDYKKKEFFSPNNDTNDFALSEEEIKAIEDIDLSKFDRLDNARDWFVIGTWCGLRVSDLLNLTKKDIEDEFIINQNKKTDIPVVIPIHKSVQKVLDKRNGEFPRKISDQKFNEYIKEVAEKANVSEMIKGGKMMPVKIKGYSKTPTTVYRKVEGEYPKHELLTSHCCRRTFATFHYGKLDTLTIMRVTGHKTEKQFLDYVKITPKQHAVAMKTMWNKYYKDAE